MSENYSETYKQAQEAFQQIKQKLVEISKLDLSKIHISHEWSWMPHVKDHLEFLAEQVVGLTDNLRDAPPPQTPEEIKAIHESMEKTSAQ